MHPTHPVLLELRARQAGAPRTGRLALAIEGGGMRGVVSAGMVAALQELGYAPHLFDAVFGSSAGSINGAYFIAGQAPYGTSIYFEDITGPEFIDARRLATRRPVLDLGYLLDEVATRRKPLDAERVIAYRELYTIATNATTGKKTVFEPAEDPESLRKQLRAGATIPFVAGQPYRVHDHTYVDASLVEALPWETPVERNFDFVLALSTRPLNTVRRASSTQRLLSAVWLRKASPELRSLIENRAASSPERTRALENFTKNPTTSPYVYALCPDTTDQSVRHLERNPAALISGAAAGYRAVAKALGHPHPYRFHTNGIFHGVFAD